MDLKTYAKALKARITASPPDLGNEDLSSECFTRHTANPVPCTTTKSKPISMHYTKPCTACPCGRWIRLSTQSVRYAGIIRSLDLSKVYVSASCCVMSSREALMLPYRITDICLNNHIIKLTTNVPHSVRCRMRDFNLNN